MTLPPTAGDDLPAEVDVAVCGAGPIGASTAYFLARNHPGLRVAVVSDDRPDDPEHTSTYRYSGGSIRWTWDHPVKSEMTTETAGFVRGLLESGVDLDALQNWYHELDLGQAVPALNVSAARLVTHLLDESGRSGASWHPGTLVTGVRPAGGAGRAGGHVVETSRGELRAGRVLLALGAATDRVLPGLDATSEKRQLFVLDLPVEGPREALPHTIVPLGDGWAYVFVKRFDGQFRVVVGQEDLVDDDDVTGPVDYWDKLLAHGLGDVLPWLRDARVERVLWGVDTDEKTLVVAEPAPGLLAARCGSAVRSSAWIGRTLADRLARPGGHEPGQNAR